MLIRRAETSDIAGIKKLIKGGFGRDDMEKALKRRYGDNYNLNYIIDTCPLSLVVISENGEVEGFFGLSFSPPTSLPLASEKDFDGNVKSFSLHNNQWDKWLIDTYKVSTTKIHNTVFVNFFCGGGDNAAHMLEALLRTVFEMDPIVENVAYFLPESLILFPPFSSARPLLKNDDKQIGQARLKKAKLSPYFFTDCPSYSHCTMPYNLLVCNRRDFYPEFEVRRAKVDDCDDLIPILKRNKLLNENQGDHYMSDLLEQKNENFKAIVAEVDGEIVGFICIDRDTDQAKLRETYNLELFDYLVKAPHCDPKAATRFVPTDEQLSIQNSFHVTLFCIDPKYSAFSDKFLHYAFQIWPDLDYCILTTIETAPTSPLLRFFSPVPSLLDNNKHMLFIANRYGIKGVADVVKATSAHLPAIVKLLTNMDNTEELLSCIRSTVSETPNTSFLTYVAIYDTQIIGTVLLEYTDSKKSQAYLDQFDVEQFVDLKWVGINENYSLIRYFIINPLFETHSRYICREIMRQLSLNCLLAPSNTSVKDLATKRVAIREFVPVKPRRMIEYPNNLRDGELLPEAIKGNLQIITIPLIYNPRMVVHTPIVVVGGSDTGFSFLENLIYNENIQFSNLVLISKEGCPKIEHDEPFVSKQNYNALSIKQIAIDYFVKVIEDTVIQIHRNDKVITLKSSTALSQQKVQYEYLILTPGLQYNIMDLSPKLENVMGAHGFNKAEYKKIKPHLTMLAANDKLGKIVIYGRSIQAYMVVEYCLSLGIAGPRIHFYDPSIDQPLFEDKELNEIAHKFLLEQKISYFEGHSFDSYEELDGRIYGLKFFDRMHKKVFIGSIGAFLYADELKVDPYTFKAVNDANLVFDESIIIDNVFRTHDPYVFAAGPSTKYSINLNTHWKHRFCDSKEVGTRLADFLMYLFDPNLPIDTNVLKAPVNNYSAAVKKYARLPGGLRYFHYDIPKLPGYKHEEKRRDLVIHEEGKEFCRIRVDSRGYIYSFTYLGTRDIPLQNLACLYGRHEKYFNRLVSRFDERVIPDFISYFQETWALVMFHDRFPSFISNLLEESLVKEDLKDVVDDLVSHTKEMSIAQADELYERFDKTTARDEMNQAVFEYLMTTNVFKSYP